MYQMLSGRLRVVWLSVVVIALLVAAGLVAPLSAHAAEPGVKFGSPATTGSVVIVTSTFQAPSTAGTYVFDTELFDASGTQVAQFFDSTASTANQTVTKSYSWNTTGRSVGGYVAKQGVFGAGWSGLIGWNNTAGHVELKAAASSWKLTATASTSGFSVNVTSSFTAASSGNFVLDTEVYDAVGNRAAQWFESAAVTGGTTRTNKYAFVGQAGATYVVLQGVFGANWSSMLAWSDHSAQVTIGASNGTTTSTTAVISTTTSTTLVPVKPAPQSVAGNVLSGLSFYGSNPGAAAQAQVWAASRPADAALMQRLSSIPSAVWLGGWNADIRADVNKTVAAASAAGKVPVLVAYNIPGRDCGNYSAGGSATADAYNQWISGLAAGVGGRKAVVILEPDALGLMSCLTAADQQARYALMSTAVTTLRAAGAYVYIDASTWVDATTMAGQLEKAGIAAANGFALNTSGFNSTAAMNTYGAQLSQLLGNKHYVVDTSRNGRGGNGQWCNPADQAVGQTPTTNTGVVNADAYLWVKTPGESDGTCNGGPAAGVFWPDYALGLAQRAWS